MSVWEQRLHQALLGVAVVTFFAGIVLPLMTVEKFYFLENQFSIISALVQFFEEGHYGLLALIGGFSIIFPLLKIMVLLKAVTSEPSAEHSQLMHWIHRYGRWSMLDVFVVAVMVVAVKIDAIASVQLHVGLYCFAASILLTMLISARVVASADAGSVVDGS